VRNTWPCMPNHWKLKLAESQVLTSMWNYLISYTPLHPYKIVNKGTGNESAKLDHQYLCTVKWKWSYTILKHSPHVGLNKPELLFCVLANLRPGFPLVNDSRGKPKTHVRGMRAMLKFGLTAGYVLAFVSRWPLIFPTAFRKEQILSWMLVIATLAWRELTWSVKREEN